MGGKKTMGTHCKLQCKYVQTGGSIGMSEWWLSIQSLGLKQVVYSLDRFVGDFKSQQIVALGSIFVGEGQDWLFILRGYILFHLASEDPVKKDTV